MQRGGGGKEWGGRKRVLGWRVVSEGRRVKGAEVVLQVATMRPGGEVWWASKWRLADWREG